jgi:hypothetical protein
MRLPLSVVANLGDRTSAGQHESHHDRAPTILSLVYALCSCVGSALLDERHPLTPRLNPIGNPNTLSTTLLHRPFAFLGMCQTAVMVELRSFVNV